MSLIIEISIIVDGTPVTGMLEAAPDSVVVKILSPCQNLKAGAHYSSYGMGYHRFVSQGKLNQGAIQIGKELLKELHLSGQYLHDHPEFVTRIRRYYARYNKQAIMIQKGREDLRSRLGMEELTKKEYDCRFNELQLAEIKNLTEKGSLFRQYAGELTRHSGGRAEIMSILDFESPRAALPMSQHIGD